MKVAVLLDLLKGGNLPARIGGVERARHRVLEQHLEVGQLLAVERQALVHLVIGALRAVVLGAPAELLGVVDARGANPRTSASFGLDSALGLAVTPLFRPWHRNPGAIPAGGPGYVQTMQFVSDPI